MDELKCPLHNIPLVEDIGYDGDYFCPKCGRQMFGSEEMWKVLAKTAESLKITQGMLKSTQEELRRWVLRDQWLS